MPIEESEKYKNLGRLVRVFRLRAGVHPFELGRLLQLGQSFEKWEEKGLWFSFGNLCKVARMLNLNDQEWGALFATNPTERGFYTNGMRSAYRWRIERWMAEDPRRAAYVQQDVRPLIAQLEAQYLPLETRLAERQVRRVPIVHRHCGTTEYRARTKLTNPRADGHE